MAGALARIGQTSGVDKGREVAEEKWQIRNSPRHKQQQEEERTNFHEEAIRILRLCEYVDLREEITELIVLSPATVYEIPIPKLPPYVKVRGHLLGCIKELKYDNHDLNDAKKFPRFKPDNHLKSEHDGEVTSPVGWAEPIYK